MLHTRFKMATAIQDKKDVVSLCVFCKEDMTALLSVAQPLAMMPFAEVKSSWRLTATNIISLVNKINQFTQFCMCGLPF